MPAEDRTAGFLRYVAERRCVRGSRGAVVRLARWHAPMVGREHAERLPPLRNRLDVRRWASTGHASDFVSAAEQLWREFCATLGECGAREARSLDDLDADQRLADQRRAVVMAWARTHGRRIVTAAELCDAPAVREAIGVIVRPGLDPDEAVTPHVVSRFVAGLLGFDIAGWRIDIAAPEHHTKVKRWKLDPLTGDDGRPDPWL